MSKIDANRNHNMPLDDAKKTVAAIVNDVKDSYPSLIDKIDWNGDKTSANVSGKMFKGEFKVDDSIVSIKVKLGLMARPFKGKVESKINSKLDEYFG